MVLIISTPCQLFSCSAHNSLKQFCYIPCLIFLIYTTPLHFAICSQIGGLASENVRWAVAVTNFKLQERTLCGDVLLITAFVSYLGYFTKRYRLELMDNTWMPYLSQLKVCLQIQDLFISEPVYYTLNIL